jgi:hypothetical protein
MNKMFLTLAAAAALTMTAAAQAPVPAAGCPTAPAAPMYSGPVYGGGYGFGHMGHGFGHVGHGLPLGHGLGVGGLGGGFLSGLFTNHGHPFGKQRSLFGGPDPANAQPLPVATQGTLVFPQNPFVRSPRDFFMYDLR